jgi:hypothetical protein
MPRQLLALHNFSLAAALLALLAVRLLWLHGDPTDFPLDRNFTTLQATLAIYHHVGLADGAQETGARQISLRQLAPELPVQPWLSAQLFRLHVPRLGPVVAARLVALAAAILTALGLLLLARRLFPTRPAVGLVAVWIYALQPLSILLGRSMLPDPLMLAALTWAFVFALTPSTASVPFSLLGASLSLALAALLKLPALWFAPLVVWPLFVATPGPRHRALLRILLCLLGVWLITCLWYRITPWNPFPGLRRISANTSDVFAHLGELRQWSSLRVLADRLMLAWTLPGTLLAALGVIELIGASQQPRRSCRWLMLWLALALTFAFVTLRANTYWIYPVVTLGALLGAVGIVGIVQRARGWGLVVVLLICCTIFICPGEAQVRDYLRRQPRYPALAAATPQFKHLGWPVFDNEPPFATAWFTGKAGIAPIEESYDFVKQNLEKGYFPYLLSTAVWGSPMVEAAIGRCPIVAHVPGSFVMFDTTPGAAIGDALTTAPATVLFSVGDAVRVHSISASPNPAQSSGTLELSIVVSRGPAYTTGSLTQLTLAFLHLPERDLIHLAPASGGGQLLNAVYPLIPLPDLVKGAAFRIHCSFPLSNQLPAGAYALSFGLRTPQGELTGSRQATDALFTLAPAPQLAPPFTLALANTPRTSPANFLSVRWPRRQVVEAELSGQGNLFFRAPLSPGPYRLQVRARGLPAGSGPGQWPVLVIRQPHAWHELVIDSPCERTYTLDIDWFGAEDYFQCYVKNPLHEYYQLTAFPLYLDELRGAERLVRLNTATFLRASNPAQTAKR